MTQTAEKSITVDELVAGSEDPMVIATRGSVRFLIFNRPGPRNAMTRAMRETYAQQMRLAEEDPAITAVVVTGAHGYFTAGVDLKENPAGSNIPMFRPHPVEVGRAMSKLTIAMVDGPCVTGGLEVALACSFIIASDRSRFVDTHINLGGMPGWGLASLLHSAIGARRALQLHLMGTFIDAQRAYEWGIVNELTSAETLLARTLEIAETIAGKPQDTVRRLIALSRQIDGLSPEVALAKEAVVIDRRRAGL
jgi:enoyl-CoA hydratase